MPCMTYSPEEERAQASREIVELNKLLCKACTLLEENGLTDKMKPSLKRWWDEHKARDAQRKERARADREARELRERALNKLDPEEQLALGFRPNRKTRRT